MRYNLLKVQKTCLYNANPLNIDQASLYCGNT